MLSSLVGHSNILLTVPLPSLDRTCLTVEWPATPEHFRLHLYAATLLSANAQTVARLPRGCNRLN